MKKLTEGQILLQKFGSNSFPAYAFGVLHQ